MICYEKEYEQIILYLKQKNENTNIMNTIQKKYDKLTNEEQVDFLLENIMKNNYFKEIHDTIKSNYNINKIPNFDEIREVRNFMDNVNKIIDEYSDNIYNFLHSDNDKNHIESIVTDLYSNINTLLEYAKSDKINYKYNDNTFTTLILKTFCEYSPSYCSYNDCSNFSFEEIVKELFKNKSFDWDEYNKFKESDDYDNVLEEYIS